MNELVSIIVPVYNLEKYIQFNIDNLLSQTYKNIEVIYVDDGSSDSSAQIIRSAAEKDNRIKYYYKENGGVSSARNLGLEKAEGKYIMFVDGDDSIHNQAVEILYKTLLDSDFDIICANAVKVGNVGEIEKDLKEISAPSVRPTSWYFEANDGFILGKSVCSKIYKKSAVQGIKFPEDFTNSEDFYFLVEVFNSGAGIGYIDTVLYYYYMRSDSLTHAKREKDVIAAVTANDEICRLAQNGSDDFLKQYCAKNLMSELLANRTYSVGMKNEKEIHRLIKDIYDKNKDSFYSNSSIDQKLKASYRVFFSSRFAYEKYRLLLDPTMKDFYNQRKQNNN